jgi:hypothetical protein
MIFQLTRLVAELQGWAVDLLGVLVFLLGWIEDEASLHSF